MKSVHMRGAQPLRMATPMRAFSRSRVVAVSAKEYKIAIIPGDGIGPEIMAVGKAVMEEAGKMHGLTFKYTDAPIGGQAIDLTGHPMPEESLKICQAADSCLMSAIGGYKWDTLPGHLRPEQGLLGLRAGLKAFANLRPAVILPQLIDASSLKREIVEGTDIMVVRELTGGIYFGQPKGIETRAEYLGWKDVRVGYNTMIYCEPEIERIARVGFETARKRKGKLCSVDKANVLDVSQLWREVVTRMGKEEYPDVELTHMYVDNCAMQIIRNPKQFDTIVTGNIFGDILSDAAAMLTGSIGMLPSASVPSEGPGLFEPVHGSAPDIAGQDVSNPFAMVLSAAMMLRYGLNEAAAADTIEAAVIKALDAGVRTGDIAKKGEKVSGCKATGEAIMKSL